MEDNFKVENFFDISELRFSELFNDVNYVWEILARISKYIETQFKNGNITGNYKSNIYLGEGSVVKDGAVILGPAIIGKNCTIGYGGLVRENCVLGDNVIIGHGSEIKNSVILNNSIIAHLNYIGDSIIGSNVNFAGGAVTANLRLDRNPVIVKDEKRKIETGLKKFGAIVGDGSSIGANVVLNPGTILGKQNIVYPLMSVKGVYKNGEIIK